MNILIMYNHKETLNLYKGFKQNNMSVKIMPMSGRLFNEDCVTIDEISKDVTHVITDSLNSALIAQLSQINNAVFINLQFKKLLKKQEIQILEQMDFHKVEVTDYESKTENDWKEAAIEFKRKFA